MGEKNEQISSAPPPSPPSSLQLNMSVNMNAGGQCVLAVDVSRATATEKQQRPFLPAAVATSSSLSPLPGADKGDVGMHNRIYVNIKKTFISPTTQFCYFFEFTRPSRRTWRSTQRSLSRKIASVSRRLQRSDTYYNPFPFVISVCPYGSGWPSSASCSLQELVDKRRSMMEDYRKFREAAAKAYQEQRSLRLELRGGASVRNYACVLEFPLLFLYFASRGEEREGGREEQIAAKFNRIVFWLETLTQTNSHTPIKSNLFI